MKERQAGWLLRSSRKAMRTPSHPNLLSQLDSKEFRQPSQGRTANMQGRARMRTGSSVQNTLHTASIGSFMTKLQGEGQETSRCFYEASGSSFARALQMSSQHLPCQQMRLQLPGTSQRPDFSTWNLPSVALGPSRHCLSGLWCDVGTQVQLTYS